MRINVVIPSYNYGKYIETAVNSVVGQKYEDLRIIIVDDGSKDNTKEVCEALTEKDSRIVYIRKTNGGVSSTRNVGIEYVLKNRDSFEYIAFLDADDLWRKDFFDEKTVAHIEEKHDVIGFEMCRCSHDLKKTTTNYDLLETPFGKPAKEEYRVLDAGAKNVRCHENSHMGAVFYSADLIEKSGIRFMEGLKYSEDKIFEIQCISAAEKIALMKRVLYVYRTNDGSAMKSAKFNAAYYMPIVNAYLECDRQMQYLKDTKSGELRWGRTLAALYTTEMIDAHFRCFGKEEEIKEILDKNPQFTENLKEFKSSTKKFRIGSIP